MCASEPEGGWDDWTVDRCIAEEGWPGVIVTAESCPPIVWAGSEGKGAGEEELLLLPQLPQTTDPSSGSLSNQQHWTSDMSGLQNSVYCTSAVNADGEREYQYWAPYGCLMYVAQMACILWNSTVFKCAKILKYIFWISLVGQIGHWLSQYCHDRIIRIVHTKIYSPYHCSKYV